MKKNVVLVLFALIAATALFAAPIRVGLVTDVGGIDDKSFNQGTWEGIKVFGKENGLKEGEGIKYLQSTADADYQAILKTFVPLAELLRKTPRTDMVTVFTDAEVCP